MIPRGWDKNGIRDAAGPPGAASSKHDKSPHVSVDGVASSCQPLSGSQNPATNNEQAGGCQWYGRSVMPVAKIRLFATTRRDGQHKDPGLLPSQLCLCSRASAFGDECDLVDQTRHVYYCLYLSSYQMAHNKSELPFNLNLEKVCIISAGLFDHVPRKKVADTQIHRQVASPLVIQTQ